MNLIGKPYAGKPHVRFDEGAGKAAALSPLYSTVDLRGVLCNLFSLMLNPENVCILGTCYIGRTHRKHNRTLCEIYVSYVPNVLKKLFPLQIHGGKTIELFENPGMNISKNKEETASSKDPIDILIFEKGLRIKTLFIEKELDILLIILNNGNLIKSKVSIFKKLASASQEDLLRWELQNEGTGVRWNQLDEDLSLRGFIKEVTSNALADQLLRINSFDVIA